MSNTTEMDNDTQFELAAWELLQEVRRERDEAREEGAHWKTEHEIVVARLRGKKHPRDNGIVAGDEIIPKLTRQRDELREALREILKVSEPTPVLTYQKIEDIASKALKDTAK